MTHPVPLCRATRWFLMPAVSAEGTLNIRPVFSSDHPTRYEAPIGEDARETRASQIVACIPWFPGDALHVKAVAVKITGVL
jgi:hypothetical protein